MYFIAVFDASGTQTVLSRVKDITALRIELVRLGWTKGFFPTKQASCGHLVCGEFGTSIVVTH